MAQVWTTPCRRPPKHVCTLEQNQTARETIAKVFSVEPSETFELTPNYTVWVNRHVMISFTTMRMAGVLSYDTVPMQGFFEGKVKSPTYTCRCY